MNPNSTHNISEPHSSVQTDASGNQYIWNTAAAQWMPDTSKPYTDGRGVRYRYNTATGEWAEETPAEKAESVAEQPLVEPAVSEPKAIPVEPKAKDDKKKTRKEQREKMEKQREIDRQCFVYVAGMPDDVTPDEVAAFCSKCGIIRLNKETEEPKVKLYTDDRGVPKGDALVHYYKPESVDLALQLLDGADLRPGVPLTVQKAEFKEKIKVVEPTPEEVADAEARPILKKKKKGLGYKDPKLLLTWDGKDPGSYAKPFEKVVVLRSMFTPEEVEAAGDSDQFARELEAEVKEECEKWGLVRAVRVFEHNKEGVISVRFALVEDADKCLKNMRGRYFGGRRIAATKWDGKERFTTEEEDLKRANQFGDWLEKRVS